MSELSEEEIPLTVIRPRFKVDISHTPDAIGECIRKGLKKADAPCEGRVIKGHALLYLPAEEQHYWSPQLTLAFEENESGSLLRGLYGPRPAVWTLFIFFYAVIGFAALAVSMVGFSYWSLGKPAQILWALPILVIVFLSLYLVAYSGKKIGKDQMHTLHQFLETCLGQPISPTDVEN